MPDAKPPQELLENLELLTNMSLLIDEEDWGLLKDLDEILSARVVKGIENADRKAKELQNGQE